MWLARLTSSKIGSDFGLNNGAFSLAIIYVAVEVYQR